MKEEELCEMEKMAQNEIDKGENAVAAVEVKINEISQAK